MKQRVLAALICMALVVWYVSSPSAQSPTVSATIHDHFSIADPNEHSHASTDDLIWETHGHGHDLADQEHSQAFLTPSRGLSPASEPGEAWVRFASTRGTPAHFRIDRPPRT